MKTEISFIDFATRMQYGFLLHRNCFLLINMLENGMSRVLLLANRKKPSKIEPYVIKCFIQVSDLRQVGGFFRVLRFPPRIKLAATI
jgi:hypothetical protein